MKPIFLLPFLALGLFSACASKKLPAGTVRGQYVADGVTHVILRAYGAEHATVTHTTKKNVVTVKGMVSGGVGDYRSRDQDWRASSADQWGLDFVANQFGSTLVISSSNEIAYEQHRYLIDDIEIDLPPSVQFTPQARRLTVNGAADLSAP